MTIEEAQKDMRLSYFGGGTGVISSGLIWLIAGVSAVFTTQQVSLLVFFFGGMFIHPGGILLSKLFNRSGKHKKENPLAKLAMESTVLIFIGLFIAFINYQAKPDWVFPIMLLIIGGRYILFQSIYGIRLYWIFGLVLIASGVVCLMTNQAFYIAALIGGIVELIFAVLILRVEKKHGNKV